MSTAAVHRELVVEEAQRAVVDAFGPWYRVESVNGAALKGASPTPRYRRRQRSLKTIARTHALDRWSYSGGHANWLARRINAATARLAASGPGPSQL